MAKSLVTTANSGLKKFWIAMALSLALSATAQAGVIISEIMQNPDNVTDANGEWFELYNSGPTDVDIDGWTIKDNDFDSQIINNGGPLVISANGFLVLGRNGSSSTNGDVSVDYVYTSFALANSSDELILLDASLNEIDRVEWDNGVIFPDPIGASMALKDLSANNNIGSNWAVSTATFGDGDHGTPGSSNTDVSSANTAVPEPGLIPLLGLGIFGISFAARRRKAQ